MTQQEFEKLAGRKIDSKSYEKIEHIYMATSFSKDKFCEELNYIRRGIDILESDIITDLINKIDSLENLIEVFKEQNKEVDDVRTNIAYILIAKAVIYEDLDLYNIAIDTIGQNRCILFKIEHSYLLWQTDIEYIKSKLEVL